LTKPAFARRFDRAYYQRFYFDARTAVTPAKENAARARLIAAGVDYLDVRVRRILDAGCGIGMLEAPLSRAFPGASYTGLEVSEYLCRRYGWINSSVRDYRGRGRYDLVICYDVLQYLSDRDARTAVRNLERLCRGVLYFGVLTQEDWDENCVQEQTDENTILRPDAWYRKLLSRGFVPLGLGLWVHRETPIALWSLERG
jgi:2-polyprenyl-3-methyl-5-hydroxy-6-metoxy-1,4-benzoquinol methylase